jgi:ribonuclease T1
MSRILNGFMLCAVLLLATVCQVSAMDCEEAVRELNRQLRPKIDERELVEVLRSLNASNNRKLPEHFITKKGAKSLGWRTGSDLWGVAPLRGRSIGGDSFGNREKRLPDGGRRWREADLDYHGGHRGAKRIIYADDGLRMVTVDHYRSFREVPTCK